MVAAAYSVEAHEYRSQDRLIVVENRTPARTREEAEKIKKEVEDQLFDIFCKYFPERS